MSDDKEVEAEHSTRSGAEWFVHLDGKVVDDAAEAAFRAWLDHDPHREAEFARCEAAVHLVPLLREARELRWAVDEAERIAAGSGAPNDLVHDLRWYQKPLLAWSFAGLFAVSAAFMLAERHGASLPKDSAELPVAKAESLPTPDVAQPAVLLPGDISVDARSVAVLPFVGIKGTDDAVATSRLAARLHQGIVKQLSAIPGMYVLGDETVQPYEGIELGAQEIAMQLGVRGVVEGRVGVENGQVSVFLRFTDATDARFPLQNRYERPLRDLTAINTDIVTRIVMALTDASKPARPQASRSQGGST